MIINPEFKGRKMLFFVLLCAQKWLFRPSEILPTISGASSAYRSSIAFVAFYQYCGFKALSKQGQGISVQRGEGNMTRLCLFCRSPLPPAPHCLASSHLFLDVYNCICVSACSCSNFFLTSFSCSVNRPLVAHHWLLIAAGIVWSLSAQFRTNPSFMCCGQLVRTDPHLLPLFLSLYPSLSPSFTDLLN